MNNRRENIWLLLGLLALAVAFWFAFSLRAFGSTVVNPPLEIGSNDGQVVPPPVVATCRASSNHTIIVSWPASYDTNVLYYEVRLAYANYCTPEVDYWPGNTTNCRVKALSAMDVWGDAFQGVSWILVQAFNPWHQSQCGTTNYVRFPGINTRTNVVITVTGALEMSPDLTNWAVFFEDPWIRTNPPGPEFFRALTRPSITNYYF